MRDPGADRLARVAAAQWTPVHAHLAAGHRTHPGHRLRELALPVPRDACDGDDLAGADRQRDALQRLAAAIADRAQLVELQRSGPDLDALLLPERELPDPRPRIDVHPVALRQLADAPLDRTLVDEERAPLAPVVAEHDVLRDRERDDKPEMLVHHRDARVDCVAGRV